MTTEQEYKEQAIKTVAEALKCTRDEVIRDAWHTSIHEFAVTQTAKLLAAEDLLKRMCAEVQNTVDLYLVFSYDEHTSGGVIQRLRALLKEAESR